MSESATDPHVANGTSAKLSALASQYAPGQERPLGSYAIVTGVYGAGVAGSLIALRARSRAARAAHNPRRAAHRHCHPQAQSPDRQGQGDELHTRTIHPISGGKRSGRGRGGTVRPRTAPRCRRAPGVPYCLAQWVATGLALGLIGAPRLTRLISTVFVAPHLSPTSSKSPTAQPRISREAPPRRAAFSST